MVVGLIVVALVVGLIVVVGGGDCWQVCWTINLENQPEVTRVQSNFGRQPVFGEQTWPSPGSAGNVVDALEDVLAGVTVWSVPGDAVTEGRVVKDLS